MRYPIIAEVSDCLRNRNLLRRRLKGLVYVTITRENCFIFRKYTMHSLHSSEGKLLQNETATRYLLNVQFHDNMMDINVRVSEYLFYDDQRMQLCTMNAFKWKRDSTVTIVTVLREMGSWSHFFIDHLYGTNYISVLFVYLCM